MDDKKKGKNVISLSEFRKRKNKSLDQQGKDNTHGRYPGVGPELVNANLPILYIYGNRQAALLLEERRKLFSLVSRYNLLAIVSFAYSLIFLMGMFIIENAHYMKIFWLISLLLGVLCLIRRNVLRQNFHRILFHVISED